MIQDCDNIIEKLFDESVKAASMSSKKHNSRASALSSKVPNMSKEKSSNSNFDSNNHSSNYENNDVINGENEIVLNDKVPPTPVSTEPMILSTSIDRALFSNTKLLSDSNDSPSLPKSKDFRKDATRPKSPLVKSTALKKFNTSLVKNHDRDSEPASFVKEAHTPRTDVPKHERSNRKPRRASFTGPSKKATVDYFDDNFNSHATNNPNTEPKHVARRMSL